MTDLNEITPQPAQQTLKKIDLAGSLLYFGIPAAVFYISFHYWRPALESGGMLPYYAYLTSLGIPVAFMLIASLVALRQEGYALSWASIKDRFRLKPMDGRTWLGILVIWIVFGVILTGLFGQLSLMLIRNGLIRLPADLPGFMDPFTAPEDVLGVFDAAVGGLLGNWMPALALLVVLFFNIIGEEFWWRGVVLPRQELAFGKQTWWIHGLFWAFFHVFKWWDVLNLVPITLAISWFAIRKRSTSPGIVIHFLVNGLGLLPFIAGALGLLK